MVLRYLLPVVGFVLVPAALWANPAPVSPEARAKFDAGVELQKQGLNASAISSYQDAVRLAPEMAEAHANLGDVLADSGNTAEAEAQMREAIHLDPNNRGSVRREI